MASTGLRAYTGPVDLSGLPHGSGRSVELEPPNGGNQHVGAYVHGKIHGLGVVTWADGNKYEGELARNKMEGIGTYTWNDGRNYTGAWLGGVMHGRGVMQWPEEGMRYEGMYADGVRHGHGVQSFVRSGDRYTGNFHNDRYHGFGIYVDHKNDTQYEGTWEHGQKSGWGVRTQPGGETYTGEWRNDKPNGGGTEIHSNETYEGGFLNGLYHGRGCFVSSEGDNTHQYNGEFLNGSMSGFGEYKWPSGNSFIGLFVAGSRRKGIVYQTDGSKAYYCFRDGEETLLRCVTGVAAGGCAINLFIVYVRRRGAGPHGGVLPRCDDVK